MTGMTSLFSHSACKITQALMMTRVKESKQHVKHTQVLFFQLALIVD